MALNLVKIGFYLWEIDYQSNLLSKYDVYVPVIITSTSPNYTYLDAYICDAIKQNESELKKEKK